MKQNQQVEQKMNSKSIKETIDDAMRQFEIGDMKKAMDLFENAKFQFELEMKNPNEFNFEYISIVINKLCIIYCDYLADFEKAMKMNDEIIKSLENQSQNNNNSSSDIYISSLINKALILEKMDKLEESHIIFKQLLIQKSQQNSSKLDVDIRYGFARTFSRFASSKERDQVWNECLKVAEKAFSPLSRSYLEVFEGFSKFNFTSPLLFKKLKDIQTEFESKPELTNTYEYANCLIQISWIDELFDRSDESEKLASQSAKIFEKLLGKQSLPIVTIKHRRPSPQNNKEEWKELISLEKTIRQLVGIRHPEYFEYLNAIAIGYLFSSESDVEHTEFFESLDEFIEIPKVPKSTDLKEMFFLFDDSFWEMNNSSPSRHESTRNSALSFKVYRRLILLKYHSTGLFTAKAVTILDECASSLKIIQEYEKCFVVLTLSRRILQEKNLPDLLWHNCFLFERFARLYCDQLKWNDALEETMKWKEFISKHVGEKTTTFGQALNLEAFIYNKSIALEKSLETYIKAKKLFEDLHESDYYLYRSILTEMGEVFSSLGKYEETLDHCEKAVVYFPNDSDRWYREKNASVARNVMCMMVSQKTYKNEEEKRNAYLKAFTGKYSAENCGEYSRLQNQKVFLDLIQIHEKCGKPFPLDMNFTEGFVNIQTHLHWEMEDRKDVNKFLVSVLHHLITPEVATLHPKEFGRICIVPLKIAVNTLRMVRLLKSSKQNDSKMSDRKRVVLNNIIDSIGMKNDNLNGIKYFERILKFGIDRKTLGKNRTDFYVNSVAGCSDRLFQKYYNLMMDKPNHGNGARLELLSNRIEKKPAKQENNWEFFE